MKPWHVLLMIGVFLGIVQTLHLAKHDQYCKTEAEWRNLEANKYYNEDY